MHQNHRPHLPQRESTHLGSLSPGKIAGNEKRKQHEIPRNPSSKHALQIKPQITVRLPVDRGVMPVKQRRNPEKVDLRLAFQNDDPIECIDNCFQNAQ